MKLKLLFTTAILAISTLGLLAQDKKRKEIGFIVGLQRSNLDYNQITTMNVSEEAKSNIGGSFFLNSRLIGHFITLRTELGFYSKGGTYRGGVVDETNLSYVAAPALLLQTKIGFLKAYAGPQLGFLITAKSKTGNLEQDVKAAYKTTELMGVVGAEMNLPLRLMAGVRYNFGISNINEIAQTTSRPGMYMLYVGLRLRK
ncbi:outer membrane beta-barrel protein [Sediminibacterium sp.]|uniref:outer membrane beta-barrel protein n=1 Tax=Sediminibacterium sp. TaxID=1917865 RepID=UPI003F697163